MTTPQIRIIDGDTVTDRDMNDEELAIYETNKAAAQARTDAQAAKFATRQVVLDKLGLTADEAAALFG